MSLNFNSFAHRGDEFIGHVARELNTKDTGYAKVITRCVFRALRNRLTIEESFQMFAQLPMALKAVYVDGWKFNKKYERIKHLDDFLDEVLTEYGTISYTEYANPTDALAAVRAVFKTIAIYVSPGEIEDILGVLPAELSSYLRESIAA